MKKYLLLFGLTILFSCNGGGGGGAESNVSSSTSYVGDPLAIYAWHLGNNEQNTFSASQGEYGYDLRMSSTFSDGLTGNGISVLISDSGVEGTHEDLVDNFSNVNFDYRISAPFISTHALPSDSFEKFGDPHGTMVAGIVAGVLNNNIGSRGVAPGVTISSSNFLASDISQTMEISLNQVENDFDIVNQSWGWPQCYLVPENTTYNDQVEYAGSNFRNGKGMVIVKSAGNDYDLNLLDKCNRSDVNRVGNSNYDPDNNTPEVIITSAFNASGFASSYSSQGANIWISAPGGEYGTDEPAILTTDRSGCYFGNSGMYFLLVRGYITNSFDDMGELNPNCNYASSMNGTSSSAPMVSGAVALLLESNSHLTLRDVKHIIASTSYELKHLPNYQINPKLSSPVGHQWEQGWVTNNAGYRFHNRYGFGAVHIDAAVEMAKNNYQLLPEQYRTRDEDDEWIYSSGSLSLPIPDNSATGVANQIFVSHNFNIEAVQLRVSATHSNLGDLGIELTSPGGTKSIISNVNNSLNGLQNFNNNLFLSNAFYGESSAGLWSIKLIDGKSGSAGTLTNWKINIIGNLKDVDPGPVVNLFSDSTYGSLTSSPVVSWDASLSGNISSYEYALGSSFGLRDIREWTSVGSNRSFTASDLNLVNGQVVYFSVRAVSQDGAFSLIRSNSWTVDTSGPGISISSPSAALTRNSNVTFSVTYIGATSISLSTNDITLNKTGTANGVVSVSGTGVTSRTVTVSSISGNGTLGISIASGSALKSGNSAPSANSTSFTVDNLGPVITIGSPSTSITKNSNVLFMISYDGASSITLNSSHITLNKTGTANGTVSVSGSGASSRTVTISGITGNGTLSISIAANTAVDSLGNTALSAGASNVFTVDNTGPGISISAPSQNATASASVTYTVTYTDASLITLINSNITLNKTGNANGTLSVTGSGSSSRIITISGITGNGSLGISIASGTASDNVGNLSLSFGPSMTFIVDNLGPSITIGAPSSSVTSTNSVSYLVSYSEANSITIASNKITLNKTGSANGTVSVSGTGGSSRTVTISGITGNGSLGISIASGTAADILGNLSNASGPSSIFVVDNTGPVLSISPPSKLVASTSSVNFIITSNESSIFSLTAQDINLITTGDASGTLSISGTGSLSRTVTVSNLTGDGTISISIRSGVVADSLGNINSESSPSISFRIGCEAGSQSFIYSGINSSFIVPVKCSSVNFLIKGGSGGNGCRSSYTSGGSVGTGGKGYKFSGKLTVLPNEQLDIYVAGQGLSCPGWQTYTGGGGGGGASAILRNTDGMILLLAGGGAGGSSSRPGGFSGYSGENAFRTVSILSPINGVAGNTINAVNYQHLRAEGGWGYKIGGKGGITSYNYTAFGGGGAGASNLNCGSCGGTDSNIDAGAGNSFYNSTFVTDIFEEIRDSGDGQIVLTWGE